MHGTSFTRGWMWQRLCACIATLTVALVWAARARALDAPPLERRVTDTAALLAPDAREQLEQRLADYEAKTGHQFALLTIPSLEGDAIEDYSIRAAERWKLGSKTRDDGLLVVIAKNDRRVRVEVGRGLEGVVTDAFSARVIRNIMTPAFRTGDFPGGIASGFDALMKQASGEAVDPRAGGAPPATGAPGRAPEGGLPVGLLVAFFLLPAALAFFSRRGGRRGRGGFFVGGIPMGWGGGSGRGFGGGRGGGGFGGGGFGGGGGGSFGGGGSSGSW